MRFVFPLKLTGSLNSREHWAVRAKRVKRERAETAKAWKALAGPVPPGQRWIVTLTRISSRRVDSDNLAGRLKGVRDQVAAQLGIDDGSDSAEWHYEQRRSVGAVHAVEVRVEDWASGLIRRLTEAGTHPGLMAELGDACSTRSTGAPGDADVEVRSDKGSRKRRVHKPAQEVA